MDVCAVVAIITAAAAATATTKLIRMHIQICQAKQWQRQWKSTIFAVTSRLSLHIWANQSEFNPFFLALSLSSFSVRTATRQA